MLNHQCRAFLLMFLSYSLWLAGCKSAESCTQSTQCSSGLICNTEKGECESEAVDGGGACPEQSHQCMPAAPEGWQGPVVGSRSLTSGSLASCPDAFTESIVVYEGFETTGSCSCECPGNASDVQCSPASVTEASSCGNFATAFDTVAIPANTCVNLSAVSQSESIVVALGRVTNTGTCAPELTNTLSATFKNQERFCQAPILAASCAEGGACMAKDNAFVFSCIYQEGLHECPESYPELEMRNTGVMDERTCSSCECNGEERGPSCGGMVTLGALGSTCSSGGGNSMTFSANDCSNNFLMSGYRGMYTESSVPTLSCGERKSGGELEGEASAIGLTTFCCNLPIPQ